MLETDKDVSPSDVQTKSPWEPRVGTTVRLRSGGPVMTVVHVKATDAQCAWFTEQVSPDPYRPTPAWGEALEKRFPFEALDEYRMEVK